MLYYGTYHRNLDVKGRLLIPSKFAEGKADEMFVLRGHEGCLAVYDAASFQAYVGKFMSMDFDGDPEERARMRMVAASVHPTKIDAAGRILLGKQLLQDYGIEEEVTLIGVFDHFEIWDPTAYAKYALAHGYAYDAPGKKVHHG